MNRKNLQTEGRQSSQWRNRTKKKEFSFHFRLFYSDFMSLALPFAITTSFLFHLTMSFIYFGLDCIIIFIYILAHFTHTHIPTVQTTEHTVYINMWLGQLCHIRALVCLCVSLARKGKKLNKKKQAMKEAKAKWNGMKIYS